MPLELGVDTAIDGQNEELIQALLEEKKNIQARIDSLCSRTTSIRQSRSPIYKHRVDTNVPRSHALNVSPMRRHLSEKGSYHGPMQRTTSGKVSQQSTPDMSRMRSNLSAGSPFSSNGPVPLPRFTVPNKETSVLEDWIAIGEDSVNEYSFPQSAIHSSQKPVLENVDDYLSRTFGSADPSLVQNNHLAVQTHLSIPVTPQLLVQHSPASIYSETLTNDSTLSSEMSRQSSISDDALMGGFQMIQVNSSSSSNLSDIDENMYSFSSIGRSCTSQEQTQLLLGAGGVSQMSQHPPFTAEEMDSLYPEATLQLESMQRSPSNESKSSTSSSRSKIQLQKQNQLANARPLAAKPIIEDTSMSRESSTQSMTRQSSEQEANERRVQAIPKAPYQRPLHPKVWCKKCDEYPDGFRGEHELRRHTDRQHKVVVKKWVCSEPLDGLGGTEHPVPTNPLSKCKACSQLKKKYGAYYNAAAHLRRAHFNPKPKGRGKGVKSDGKVAEKRGGKGGGDWPDMTELKRWMRQVEELVVENEQQDPDDESDGDCNADYMNLDYSEKESMMLSEVVPNSAPLIDSSYLDSHMLNAYSSTAMSTHDNSPLHGMHLDMHMRASSNMDHALDMPSQNIDPSTMFSSQNIEASATFFDVQNGLLMDDMNDLSFSSLSSSFPTEPQQHQQFWQFG